MPTNIYSSGKIASTRNGPTSQVFKVGNYKIHLGLTLAGWHLWVGPTLAGAELCTAGADWVCCICSWQCQGEFVGRMSPEYTTTQWQHTAKQPEGCSGEGEEPAGVTWWHLAVQKQKRRTLKCVSCEKNMLWTIHTKDLERHLLLWAEHRLWMSGYLDGILCFTVSSC